MASPLEQLYATLGLGLPAAPTMPPIVPPATALPQRSPMISPEVAAALGLPFPTPLADELPQEDPLAALTPMGVAPSMPPPMMPPDFAAASQSAADTTAPLVYGYNPQPRPPLPSGIADAANPLYDAYRGAYGPPPALDPLAQLLGGPAPGASGLGPGLTPPWMGRGAMGYGGGPGRGDFASRFSHPIDRMAWLNALRGRRGF